MARRVSLKGRGADIFFGDYSLPESEEAPPSTEGLGVRGQGSGVGGQEEPPPPADGPAASAEPRGRQERTMVSRDHGTTLPRSRGSGTGGQGSGAAGVPQSALSTQESGIRGQGSGVGGSGRSAIRSPQSAIGTPQSALVVEAIRKTVKAPGREAATLRLTPAEKERLADVIYSYRRQGTRTSETEIIRIALNLLLEDFEAQGDQSILASVLEALAS